MSIVRFPNWFGFRLKGPRNITDRASKIRDNPPVPIFLISLIFNEYSNVIRFTVNLWRNITSRNKIIAVGIVKFAYKFQKPKRNRY